jgi:hypothetical protein
MAKTKEPARPLTDTRQEFIHSLENVSGTGLSLLQVVELALEFGKVDKSLANQMKERANEFRMALMGG